MHTVSNGPINSFCPTLQQSPCIPTFIILIPKLLSPLHDISPFSIAENQFSGEMSIQVGSFSHVYCTHGLAIPSNYWFHPRTLGSTTEYAFCIYTAHIYTTHMDTAHIPVVILLHRRFHVALLRQFSQIILGQICVLSHVSVRVIRIQKHGYNQIILISL